MENAIKAVHAWQVKAGNTAKPYNDFLQSAFQVEEALEGFDLVLLATEIAPRKEGEEITSKTLSREILKMADAHKMELTDVERLDKHIDSIIYNIGSLASMGLTPQDINNAILVVNRKNMQKLGMPRDELGKLMKPADFVGPEPELLKILQARKC